MRLALRFGAIESRAFENDVYADLAPRQVSGVLFRIDLYLFSVDDDGVVRRGDLVRQSVSALRGIIFEKVCEHSGIGQVVDRDNVVTLGAEHLSESQTADAAESVDCNFYICHLRNSSK